MSTPGESGARPDETRDTDAGTGAGTSSEPPFDPYRFGKPDHPVPREYWPPGYVPDPEPTPAPPGAAYPSPQAGSPYGAPPYGHPEQRHGQYPGQYPGQQPYGYPPHPGHGPPPMPYGYQASRPSTTKAVLALVFGIASIVLCWLSILDAVAIVPAIVLGIIALNEATRNGGAGKGLAVAGLACAVAGTVLAVVATILFNQAVNSCGGNAGRDDPAFTQCVQDNIF